MHRNKNKSGFTLVEVLIVCTMLSMVALVGVAHYCDVEENAVTKIDEILCIKLAKAVRQFYNDTGEPPCYIAEVLSKPKFDSSDENNPPVNWWWRKMNKFESIKYENLKMCNSPYISRALCKVQLDNSNDNFSEYRLVYNNKKLKFEQISSISKKSNLVILNNDYVEGLIANKKVLISNFHFIFDKENDEIGIVQLKSKPSESIMRYQFDSKNRMLNEIKNQNFDESELLVRIPIYWTGVPCPQK